MPTDTTCSVCNGPISIERIECFLEIKGCLPTTCVGCSSEKKNVALMDYGHKTGGEPVVVSTNGINGKENIRRAMRVYNRSR